MRMQEYNHEELSAELVAALATGGTVIKFPSPLNVLKDTYDHICYWARSDEYQHLMTDSPAARLSRHRRRSLPA